MCLEIITASLLGLTLIAIIWYAWETRRLRIENVKQTELSLRPYIILYSTQAGKIGVENIGLSHALDVVIDTLEMNVFRVLFQPRSLVRHGQPVAIEVTLEGKNPEADKMIRDFGADLGFPFFKDLEKVRDYPLTVHYKNIEGTSYFTQLEVKVKEKRIVVIKSEKS